MVVTPRILSKNVLTLCVLILACNSSKVQPIVEALKLACTFDPTEKVHEWDLHPLKNIGTFGGYYGVEDDEGKHSKKKYQKGLMIRRTIVDEYGQKIVEMSEKMSDWNLGPDYYGCQIVQKENGNYALNLVYERTITLASNFEKTKKVLGTNFKASYVKLMNFIKEIHSKGYYHNNIKPYTLSLDSNNNFRLVDPDFMVLISEGVTNQKPIKWAMATDAPSLFIENAPLRDIDDYYSAALVLGFSLLPGSYDDYFKAENIAMTDFTQPTNCFAERGPACTKFIARNIVPALGKNILTKNSIGWTYYNIFTNRFYAESIPNWDTIDKAKIFETLNLYTLTWDLLDYYTFPLNEKQFLDLVTFFGNKRILI